MGRPKELWAEGNIKADLALRLYKEGLKISEIMKRTNNVTQSNSLQIFKAEGCWNLIGKTWKKWFSINGTCIRKSIRNLCRNRNAKGKWKGNRWTAKTKIKTH